MSRVLRIQVDEERDREDVVVPRRRRHHRSSGRHRRHQVVLYNEDDDSGDAPVSSPQTEGSGRRPRERRSYQHRQGARRPARRAPAPPAPHLLRRHASTAVAPRHQHATGANGNTPVTPESQIPVKEDAGEQQRDMYYPNIANAEKLLDETPQSRVHLSDRPLTGASVAAQPFHRQAMSRHSPSPGRVTSLSPREGRVTSLSPRGGRAGFPDSAELDDMTSASPSFHSSSRRRRRHHHRDERSHRHHRSSSSSRRRYRSPRSAGTPLSASPRSDDEDEDEDALHAEETPPHTPMDPVESKRIVQLAELIQWQETGLDIEEYFDRDTDSATLARIHAKAKRKMGQSHYVQNGKAMIVGIAAFIEKAFRTGRNYGFNIWDIDGYSMSLTDPEENEKFNVPLMRAYQMYARGKDESNPFVSIAITMALGAYMFSQEKQRASEEMRRYGAAIGGRAPDVGVDAFIQQNPSYSAAIAQRMGVAMRAMQTLPPPQPPRQPIMAAPPRPAHYAHVQPPAQQSAHMFQDTRQWQHGPPTGNTFTATPSAPTPHEAPAPRSSEPYQPRSLFQPNPTAAVPPRRTKVVAPSTSDPVPHRRRAPARRRNTGGQARLPASVFAERPPRKSMTSGWTLDDDVFHQQSARADDILTVSSDEDEDAARVQDASGSDDDDDVIFEDMPNANTSTPGTMDMEWGGSKTTNRT